MNLKNAIMAKLASARASAELKKANSALKQYKSILGRVNQLRAGGLTVQQAVERVAAQDGKTVEQILGKAELEKRGFTVSTEGIISKSLRKQ